MTKLTLAKFLILNYTLHKIHTIAQGNPEAINRFNKLFVEQTIDVDLLALKQSANNRDWAMVKELAHKMKPSLDIYEVTIGLEIIRELSNIGTQPMDEKHWLQMIDLLYSKLTEVKADLLAKL